IGTKELFSEEICTVCDGARLNDSALSVKIEKKSIWEIVSMNIDDSLDFFKAFDEKMSNRQREIAGAAVKEIINRLQFMMNVGLHYLSLARKAGTLSGGEAQRIRLASQVGQRLVGAMYILDEPTIGLHQRDNEQLVQTLRNLCDIGNTILVVEHDEDTILASDWVVDIGPGAGKKGGEVVFSGPLENLIDKETNPKMQTKNKLQITNSKVFDCKTVEETKHALTGKYLRGELKIDIPKKRRKVDQSTPKLKIKGASEHNLKNLSVDIPHRRFVTLTGVSGSGKSTLMNDIVYRAIANKLHHVDKPIGKHKQILGIEYIDKIIKIDQNPIGRTPRSNPATYTKAFDHIRDLFASTTEARIRGYNKGRFSFNKPASGKAASKSGPGGRCEHCAGRGTILIEMHFLPSVEIMCEVCKGERFDSETLQVHYDGKDIAEVLSMTIAEAEEFFKDIPQIHDKLKILNDVGLNYLTLGQSATTLSGGEAQRIKLSRELAKRNTTKTMYLLDEPTTGLHYDDVKKLIDVLQRLVSQGNTVMVIEHNLDVIKQSDWIIDLGPEGGDKGGELVTAGTPEQVAKVGRSFTGQYLKKYI
ncbi:MAG: excinuclease ABC subunit UvrA, partial [Candidatus Magasanikbacteria bacterium]